MKYTCIIVEDEILMRDNIEKKIKNCSDVFTLTYKAKNGRDALDHIVSNGAIPSLVITDIKMPVLDGLALTKELYYHYPKVKIVLISSFNDFSYAQQAIKYKVNDYLLKPISDSVLKECLLSIQMQLDMEKTNLHSKIKFDLLSNTGEYVIPIICDYILLHYKEEIDWENLAGNLNFSLSYIRKMFKQEMNYSLGQYQTSLRINEAKNLLLNNPDLTVSAIGKLVGYEDQYYFSRIFQKHTGCYPSNYRSPSVLD